MVAIETKWYHPGQAWGVGVSGGGDSLALLHLLVAAHGAKPWHAILVNHGWNAAFAKQCQTLVQAQCKLLGVPLTVVKVAKSKPKTNPEAAARTARYAAFAKICVKNKLTGVALGHTRSDEVEQFLMRAGRGSGLAGLAGIPAQNTISGVRVARPLLAASRDDLRAYLKKHKLNWAEDPSNAASQRGKIRAKLKGDWLNEAAVAASIASLARANSSLESATTSLLEQVTVSPKKWACERAWLLNLPEELALRLLAKLIQTDTEAFAPRTSRRQSLLENIRQNPQGTATLGSYKLSWKQGSLHGGLLAKKPKPPAR